MTFHTLERGSRGAEVGNLQQFLNAQGFSGIDNRPLHVDEVFGANTAHALADWQGENELLPSAVLDGPSRVKAEAAGFIPFIQAANCKILFPRQRDLPPRKIVIHTTENQDKPGVAEGVARWFGGELAPKYPAPKASAHYVIDCDRLIQCVRVTDVAWHAPGANADGIGIEHAGFAKQTPTQWDDEYSKLVLERSAKLVSHLCLEYAIPPFRLDAATLRNEKTAKGIAGHSDISQAFGGTHWDPGPNFPWDSYLARVSELIARAAP